MKMNYPSPDDPEYTFFAVWVDGIGDVQYELGFFSNEELVAKAKSMGVADIARMYVKKDYEHRFFNMGNVTPMLSEFILQSKMRC